MMKGTEDFIRDVLHDADFASQCLRMYESRDENFAKFLERKGYAIHLEDLDEAMTKIGQEDIFLWSGLYRFSEPKALTPFILQISSTDKKVTLHRDQTAPIVLTAAVEEAQQFTLNGYGKLILQFCQHFTKEGLIDASTVSGKWYPEGETTGLAAAGKQLLTDAQSDKATWQVTLNTIGITSILGILGAAMTIKGYFNWCCGCNKDGICQSQNAKDKKILSQMQHEQQLRERYEREIASDLRTKLDLTDVVYGKLLDSGQKEQLLNNCGSSVSSWVKNENTVLDAAKEEEAQKVCQTAFENALVEPYKDKVQEILKRQQPLLENPERLALLIADIWIKEQKPYDQLPDNGADKAFLREYTAESIAAQNEGLWQEQSQTYQQKIDLLTVAMDQQSEALRTVEQTLQSLPPDQSEEQRQLAAQLEELQRKIAANQAERVDLASRKAEADNQEAEERRKKDTAHERKEQHRNAVR